MAKWTKNKVTPEQINNGNEYSVNDNLSVESINAIINNSFKAQEDSEEALKKANSAYEANGTLVKINGENQTTWDATISQKISEESANEIQLQNKSSTTTNGITYSVIDNGISLNGTNTLGSGFAILLPLVKPLNLTNMKNYGLFNSSTGLVEANLSTGGGANTIQLSCKDTINAKTIINSNATITYIRLWISAGAVLDMTIKPMVTRYELPKEYQIYNPNRHITNDEAEFLKEKHNKSVNQLDISDIPSFTQKGITCSVSKGKITLSGTATDNWNLGDYYSYSFPIGTYSYSLFNNEINNNIQIGFKQSSTQHYSRLNEVNKTVENVTTTDNSFFNIRIPTGTTISNLILTPIVVIGDKASDVFFTYNSASHITNAQADLLKSEHNKTINLFDKNSVLRGYEIDNGGIKESPTWYVSDYIRVSKGDTLIKNQTGGNNTLVYDSNKNMINSISFVDNILNIDLDNAYYIRINGWLDNIDSYQLEFGTTPTQYQPYNGPIIHEKDIKPELLWKNATPNQTSGFSAGETFFSENINSRTYFYVEYVSTNNMDSGIFVAKYRSGKTYYSINKILGNGDGVTRAFDIVNGHIYWGDSKTNGVVDNTQLIPFAVYSSDY